MNTPRTVVGLAVLVVAAFWAFLLVELLQAMVLIVLAAPFVVLLAFGVYIVIDGLGGFSVQGRGSRRDGKRLGALDVMVLQMTAQRKSQQEIVSASGVSPSVIAEKVAALTRGGYLDQESLSEKGYEALKSAT